MFKYFNKCKTAEAGKKLYRELAKKYHTDNGGNDSIMKEINAEFSEWWKRYKNIHEAENNTTYEKETTETAEDYMNIINELVKLQGIEIEICGTWIWISGNTYKVKDQLKALGCKFASKKVMWYYTTEPCHNNKKQLSMNEIRDKYGSQKVKSTTDESLKITTKHQ